MSDRGAPFGAERLAGAAAWRLTFLAIQSGSSVILFAALSHVLGRRALAATAIAQGVIVIAQSIGDFGLSQAAVTVLPGRIAARPGDRDRLVAGAAAAYLGATALAVLLTLAAVPLVPGAAAAPVAVSSVAAGAAVLVSGADGILRSQGQFRRPLVLMAASELAGFAGIPVAAITGSALWTSVAVAGGMTVGASGAAVVLLALHRLSDRPAIRPFVRAGLPLGLSQVFIALATRVDTLIAGLASGLLAAGTFEGCWRIYQLSQYVAGGIASAAAPFVADALGAGRIGAALLMIRTLSIRLFVIGLAGGAALFLLRSPIANVLAGALAANVAHALPVLAAVSPLQAVALVAYYTLASRDGQRRRVLLTIAAGAAVNLALAVPLGSDLGARGIVIACAAGQATTAILLLVPMLRFVRGLRDQRSATPDAHVPSELIPPVP